MAPSAQDWIHVRVDAPTPRGAQPGLVTSAKAMPKSYPPKWMLTICLDTGGMVYAQSDQVQLRDELKRLPHWQDHGLSEYCRAKHENGNYTWWAVCVCGYQTPKFSTREGAKELYDTHFIAVSRTREPDYQSALRKRGRQRRR